MRRKYVAALIEVPQKDASLLVAAICTTEAPGRPDEQGRQLDQPAATDDGVDEARGQRREDQEEDDLQGEVSQSAAHVSRRRCLG